MSDIKLFRLTSGTATELQGSASDLEMLLHIPNGRPPRRSSRNSEVKETPHA